MINFHECFHFVVDVIDFLWGQFPLINGFDGRRHGFIMFIRSFVDCAKGTFSKNRLIHVIHLLEILHIGTSSNELIFICI